MRRVFQYIEATRTFNFIKEDHGAIRNFVAVGGSVLALFSFPYWICRTIEEARFMNKIQEIHGATKASLDSLLEISGRMGTVVERLGEGVVNMRTSLAITTILDLDAGLRESTALLAQDLLSQAPFDVPAEKKDRDALRALADWAANLAVVQGAGLFDGAPSVIRREFVVEKYGALIERIVANPYIQDQMLANPVRWSSVYAIGKHVLDTPSPGVVPTLTRQEAASFVKAYPGESTKCSRQFLAVVTENDAVAKDKLLTDMRFKAAGEDGFLFCSYARGTFERTRRAIVE